MQAVSDPRRVGGNLRSEVLGAFVAVSKQAPTPVNLLTVVESHGHTFSFQGINFKFASVGATASVTLSSEKDRSDTKQITLTKATRKELPVTVAGCTVEISHTKGLLTLNVYRNGCIGKIFDVLGGVLSVSYKFNFSDKMPETEITSEKAKVHVFVPQR